MGKLEVVDNLRCSIYKGNSAEILVEFFINNQKTNYPQIKSICWDLLALIEMNSRDCCIKFFKFHPPTFNLI